MFLCLLLSVVSVDEDKEVIGNLKVSLEAAKALTGIYQEFHHKSKTESEDETDEEKDVEGEKTSEEEEQEKKTQDPMQLLDCGVDDSDFY